MGAGKRGAASLLVGWGCCPSLEVDAELGHKDDAELGHMDGTDSSQTTFMPCEGSRFNPEAMRGFRLEMAQLYLNLSGSGHSRGGVQSPGEQAVGSLGRPRLTDAFPVQGELSSSAKSLRKCCGSPGFGAGRRDFPSPLVGLVYPLPFPHLPMG